MAVVEVFGTGDAGPGLQVPARLAGQGAVAGGRATGRWMLQLWRDDVVGGWHMPSGHLAAPSKSFPTAATSHLVELLSVPTAMCKQHV